MAVKRIERVPSLPPRDAEAHKGNFGRVVVIAGSRGMVGAASLTTQAVLRSGAALATLAVPASLLPIAASKFDCAMTYPLPETNVQTLSEAALPEILELAAKSDIIAIGPGLSQHRETQQLLRQLLPQLAVPVVVDADGLNGIAGQVDVLLVRQHPTILTPHPGEFCRLANIEMSRLKEQREDLAVEFARRYRCIVALKFARTIVTDGECLFINTTGNPGMATGGSGDVLTGVIAGVLAQKLEPFAATQLGVWVHGYAGDIACREKGEVGMIATDILQSLPQAFREMQG